MFLEKVGRELAFDVWVPGTLALTEVSGVIDPSTVLFEDWVCSEPLDVGYHVGATAVSIELSPHTWLRELPQISELHYRHAVNIKHGGIGCAEEPPIFGRRRTHIFPVCKRPLFECLEG